MGIGHPLTSGGKAPGEKCQWHFASESTLEFARQRMVFIDVAKGSRNVTWSWHSGEKAQWAFARPETDFKLCLK